MTRRGLSVFVMAHTVAVLREMPFVVAPSAFLACGRHRLVALVNSRHGLLRRGFALRR
jgi:hypothetical protein